MYYYAQPHALSNHHRRQHDNDDFIEHHDNDDDNDDDDDDHSDDIQQLMNHQQQHSSLLYGNSLPLHLPVNTNQTDNKNGTSNDEPSSDDDDDVVLDYLVDTCDILTWASLFIYLLYLLIRTLVTFPYRSLLNVFVTTCCRAAKNKNRHSDDDDYAHQYHFYETNNNKNSSSHSGGGDGGGGGSGRLFVTRFKSFMSDMTSSCYLFARPIARLVFLLLISDWLVASTSIVNLIYNRLNANVPMRACRFQAFMTQFFGLNTYCWLFVISVWMFYIVVLNRRNHLIVLEIASHVFAWSVSIVFTVIPFAAGAIESNGASYCWISGKTAKGRSLILIAYYIPLWIFMILISCTCLIACIRLIRVQYLSSMGTHASTSTAGTTTTSAANASPFNTTTQSRIHVKSHPHITHAYLDDDETLNEEYIDDDFEESEYDSGNNRMMVVSTINGCDDIDLHSVNIDDDELTNTTYRDKNIQNNNNNRKTLISHVRISLRLYIKLLGLPIVFVLIWIAPSVRRIKTVIGNGVPLSLEYAHNISAALQGFLFVVVIVLSDVIGYWNERRSNKCCGLCCSKRRKRQRRVAKVKNHSKLLVDTTYDQSSDFISSSQPASETHYARFT